MPRGSPSVWTTAEIATLKRTVADGCTLGQILLALKSKFSASVVKRKMAAEKIVRPQHGNARWPAADIAVVKACIAEGLTASQCQRRLGNRHTRNSILGICARKGLHFGRDLDAKAARRHDDSIATSKFHVAGAGGKKAQHQNGATPKPSRPTAAMTRDAIDALPEPVAIGPINTFPDDSAVRPRMCRAIAADPLSGNWRCCGQPTVTGRPYCGIHAVKFCDPSGAAGKPPPWLVSGGAVAKVFA